MKTPLLAATALTLSALVATPAAAQVNGIAVTDPSLAVASATAVQNGFQQIATTFQAQRTQSDQLQQQRVQLVQQLDSNGDGQLSEAEAAAAPEATVQQVQALDQQITQVQGPVTQARLYVVEQILQQYGEALQQVINERGVQLVLTPENAIYIGEAADITEQVLNTLNTRVPAVTTTVPQGWQPQRQTVTVYQEVQQILVQAAMQQQAAAAQPAAPVQGR